MTLNFGMLELTTGIPETLSASTTNLGLLGNINGDIKDDFYTPNGTLLPFNATEKELYFNFGELCMTALLFNLKCCTQLKFI